MMFQMTAVKQTAQALLIVQARQKAAQVLQTVQAKQKAAQA